MAIDHTSKVTFRVFSLVSWLDWVHLTSAANWPIVPAPDDRWWRVWTSWWNGTWLGQQKYSEKTCPSATLSTTNPTWPDLGSNPGRRGGKLSANRLSFGTAYHYNVTSSYCNIWWLPKSLYRRCRCTRRSLFRYGCYSRYDAPSEMFQTDNNVRPKRRWPYYINIIIMFPYIIRRPVFI
jgi:hypothetical protein